MKAIIFAALLGLSAASSMVQWSYPKHSDLKYLIDKSILGLGFYFEIDMGYGSHYIGEEPDTSNSDLASMTYGVHLYSRFRSNYYFNIMGMYERLIELEFLPVYWAPYEQKLEYTALQSDSPMTLTATGQSQLNIFEYSAEVTENWKTFEVSLLDGHGLLPSKSTWSFDDDYEHNYMNPYMTFNIVDIVDWFDSNSWLGVHVYWTKDIIS